MAGPATSVPILIFHQVAASKLAIDCEIEERPVAHSSFPIQKEPD